ncbi:hypothetical protein GCM10025865_16640 [Paraoerskovia sediminicola]|uniref:Urease alpha-subunit N-terminal domain-containing protein n=1 Tax=Paraoerskovia sediminicola TaxID=1138587 RepID=A0ABM8G2M7_9CELL|nr:hypothetical protein GCM10025865_16640 [Paraoerskovia sediminicola]
MVEIDRARYAALYGPSVGDQVRLADTDLWIEVEHDLTVGGEEAVFGGGKSIRESMAQGSTTRAEGAPDTVITNAIVLDHTGVYRADVGVRDGLICGIGRAGNPDVADGVDPALRIGPSTDVVSGKAASSPREASTPTSTSSRRRRSTRLSLRVSRRSRAAARGRARAPRPRR